MRLSIRARWQQDIFFRLWFSIVLSVTLVSGFSTLATIESLRRDAQTEINDRVDNMAGVLVKTLARPLFDINTVAIASVGDAVGLDPQIMRLRVSAPDGSVLVESGNAGFLADRAISRSRDVHYTSLGKTYLVGHIEVFLSTVATDQKFQAQIIRTSVSGLLLILTVTLSLYLVGRTITKPYGDIHRALDRLAQGALDIELSGMGRADQIGRLSQAIERFRCSLNELRAAEQKTALLLAEKTDIADKLNAIYEGSNDAVMLLDDQGIFDCNKRTLEMFGVSSRREFITLSPADLSPPLQPDGRDSRMAAAEKVKYAFQTGGCQFEWTHMTLNGYVFTAEVLLSAFEYEGRRVLHATVRDISDRKRIEKELQELNNALESKIELRTQEMRVTLGMLAESQQKLQGIVDTALDAVVRADANGTIVGWNTQAEVVFGWQSHEVLGRTLHETIIAQQHRQGHLQGLARFVATGVTKVIDRRIEMVALHRSGREFPIEIAVTRVSLADTNKFEFCAFIRDITERQRAEEEVRTSLEKQKELIQMKSRFVTMTSHEFRTPLATILSSTDLLKHYADRLPPEERDKLFQSITMAVRRMTLMLEDVLTLGKDESNLTRFNPVALAIDQFCRQVVDEIQDQQESLGSAGCRVNLVFEGEGMQACFDERLLRQIFHNLLSNAMKYSPNGANIDFKLSCDQQAFVFTVADQGIGVPPEELPHLFESFHRASNVGNIAGTGLGLAIAKRSVELHSGTICVSSVLGQGTIFRVTLPRLPALG